MPPRIIADEFVQILVAAVERVKDRKVRDFLKDVNRLIPHSSLIDASHLFVGNMGETLPKGTYTVIGRLASPSATIEGETSFIPPIC